MATLKEVLQFFEDVEMSSKWAMGEHLSPKELDDLGYFFDASILADMVETSQQKLLEMKNYASELISGAQVEKRKSFALIYFFDRMAYKAARHNRCWRFQSLEEKE